MAGEIGAPTSPQMPVPAAPLTIDVPGSGLRVGDYLSVLSRRKWWIILPTLVGLGLATAASLLIPPLYEGSTRIKLSDTQLLKGLVGRTEAVIPYKPILKTIRQDIVRKPFLQPIILDVGLTEGYSLDDREQYRKLFEHIEQHLQIDAKTTQVGADVISFTYQGRDTHKNTEFLRQISDRYIDEFLGEYGSNVQRFNTTLRRRKNSTERRLREVELDHQKFLTDKTTRILVSAEQNKDLLAALERRRLDEEAENRRLETRESSLQRQLNETLATVVESTYSINPLWAKADEAFRKIEAALVIETEVKGRTESVPEVIKLREELAKARAARGLLQKEVVSARTPKDNPRRTTIELDLEAVRSGLNASHQSLSDLRVQIANLRDLDRLVPDLQRRDREFKREKERLTSEFLKIDDEYQKVKNTWDGIRRQGRDIFSVLDHPEPQEQSVFPPVPLFLVVGTLAGLMLGLGFAFLKEFSGMTFTSSSQVSNVLPVPVLGEVGRIRTPSEELGERRRRLRTGLIVFAILAVLALVHVLYFNPEWSRHLPSGVSYMMDKIYQAR